MNKRAGSGLLIWNWNIIHKVSIALVWVLLTLWVGVCLSKSFTTFCIPFHPCYIVINRRASENFQSKLLFLVALRAPSKISTFFLLQKPMTYSFLIAQTFSTRMERESLWHHGIAVDPGLLGNVTQWRDSTKLRELRSDFTLLNARWPPFFSL